MSNRSPGITFHTLKSQSRRHLHFLRLLTLQTVQTSRHFLYWVVCLPQGRDSSLTYYMYSISISQHGEHTNCNYLFKCNLSCCVFPLLYQQNNIHSPSLFLLGLVLCFERKVSPLLPSCGHWPLTLSLQYSLAVKREVIHKLAEVATKEENRLQQAETFLDEDTAMFDEFLEENDKNSVEAIKMYQTTVHCLYKTVLILCDFSVFGGV